MGIGEIAGVVFRMYPKRTFVGLSLFTGQAFLYNAIFFTYALVLTEIYGVSASQRRPLPAAVRGRQLPRAAAARAASSTPSAASR